MFRYLLAAAVSHLFVCIVLDPRLIPDFPHVLTFFACGYSAWGILVMMKPGLFGSAGLAVAALVLIILAAAISFCIFALIEIKAEDFLLLAFPVTIGPFLCLCGLVGLRFSNHGAGANE